MAPHKMIKQTAARTQAFQTSPGKGATENAVGINQGPDGQSNTDNLGPAVLDTTMVGDPNADTIAAHLQKWLRHRDPSQRLCPYHTQVIETWCGKAAAIHPLDRFVDNLNPSNQPCIYRGLNGASLSISKPCTCPQVDINVNAGDGVERQGQSGNRHNGAPGARW